MTTKKPSAVAGLRRGVSSPPAERAPLSEDLKEFSDAMRSQAETTEAARRPRPDKPVRFTLDLDQKQHQFLKTWAANRSIGAAQVLRELLKELEDDPDLAIRIRDRIWTTRKLDSVRRLEVDRPMPRSVASFAGQHQMAKAPAALVRFPGWLADAWFPADPGLAPAERVAVRTVRRLMREQRRHEGTVPIERAFHTL